MMLRNERIHEVLPHPYCSKSPGIYAIVNRRNNKLYIGSAKKLHTRWNSHRHDFDVGRQNPYFTRAFRKEPDAFYIEVIEELPNSSKEIRLDREQFWMDFYQSYNPANGYNLCPKAKSCEGAKHGPEYRKKVSESVKKWARERVWTKEDREKLSKSLMGHKGRSYTPEQKLQCSVRMKGRKNSPEVSKKIGELNRGKKYPQMGRPVVQFSTDGVAIKRFQAIAYAALETGRKECNIREACKQKQKKSGGFYWRFEDELPSGCKKIEVIHNGHCRPLAQLTLNGDYIQSFSKPSLAAKATGISNVAIGQACRGASKSSGGFKWRYL